MIMSKTRMFLLGGAALLAVGAIGTGAAVAQGGHRGAGGFSAGEAFARADANADQQVTLAEGRAWLAARFAEVDANADGSITFEEMRAYAERQMSGRGRGPNAGQGADSDRAARMEERGRSMFRALDADGDGRLTLAEITPFAEAMFRARDANADGVLTRGEAMPRHGHHRGGEHRGPTRN
jgi:hypothetical protein